MKILNLWTPTKCAKVTAFIKVRGVLKTSWQWLLNGVKQQVHTILFQFAIKALSWGVFHLLGVPQVFVKPERLQIGISWIPEKRNSTYEERTPPEGSNISIFTSSSKIMLPVRKSAHMMSYNMSNYVM